MRRFKNILKEVLPLKIFFIKYFLPFIWIILILLSSKYVYAAELNKILVIHSYPKQERSERINKGIQDTLSEYKNNINYKFLYINHDVLGDLFGEYDESKWLKYEKEIIKERFRILTEVRVYKPDVIIISDDEAAYLVAEVLGKKRIPLFFLGINEDPKTSNWYSRTDKNFVAINLERYPVQDAINIIKKIKPIENVSILSSAGFSSRFIIEQVKKVNEEQGVNINIVIKSADWQLWVNAVKEINLNSDLVWVLVPFNVNDQNGNEISISKIGKWLSNNLTVPSLGISSLHTKVGIFAAVSPSMYNLGVQTAKQIIRYQNGISLEKIGIKDNRYHDFNLNIVTAEKLGIEIPEEIVLLTNARKNESILEKENIRNSDK